MLTLNDGRSELWQWDTGRTLSVDADCSQVHFSNKVFGRSIDVDVVDGAAIIPDILLQTDNDLNVWAFVGTAENGYTKISKTFKVNRRNKPADYVFTPTDQMTLQTVQSQIGDLADLTTEAKANLVAAINEVAAEIPTVDSTLTQPGQPADAAAVGDRLSVLSEEIADGVSWNELKDKPFYLEKTLVVELTKDDFTVNDQDGYIEYMYRSTPKLDWFTSAESIAFDIEIVDTNGRRYTATQDSIDVYFENDNTDDGYEYRCCYSDLFEIVSGVDLDLYDDEYYYKDEWGVLVGYYGLEFSEINIKIYRVDVKKIPESCLDAAIGRTAITVGSVLYGSEGEIPTNVVVPDLRIPISPSDTGEYIYYDRILGNLRTSGDLFPYGGVVDYVFNQAIPTTAGSSISFDISSEGDTLWDTIGYNSPWYFGRYLTFKLNSYYIVDVDVVTAGGVIEFLSCGNSSYGYITAVASSILGHLYTILFKYTNSNKTLNVTIKCVVE